jgi:integrase/recombinase XerD
MEPKPMTPTWTVDSSRILTLAEVKKVQDELKRKAKRSPMTRRNLIIFRLATGCGLRVSELTRITLADVRLGDRPTIRVRKAIGKGSKARTVPLNWDAGTLTDITEWKAYRTSHGATASDLFICTAKGTVIDRLSARMAFRRVCENVLGKDRKVTIHDGRHTFVSHALHDGHSVVEVRDAAGHSNIATTSIYAHLVGDDDGKVRNMYGK